MVPRNTTRRRSTNAKVLLVVILVAASESHRGQRHSLQFLSNAVFEEGLEPLKRGASDNARCTHAGQGVQSQRVTCRKCARTRTLVVSRPVKRWKPEILGML